MKESWKDIVGYEGLYQISDLGNVKSTYTDKILKPSADQYGYVRFSAVKNGIRKTLRIHRIVMNTFKPISENMQINHIDGNKLNNALINLEWCTDSENKKHAYANNLMPRGNQFTKKPKRNLKRYKTKS